jgi:predicted transcriptional regulator
MRAVARDTDGTRAPDGVRTVLQLDPGLRVRLAEIAREHERALVAEIRWALRQHAEREREQVAGMSL